MSDCLFPAIIAASSTTSEMRGKSLITIPLAKKATKRMSIIKEMKSDIYIPEINELTMKRGAAT